MAAEIIMPKLGVDMQEGEIIEWKKQEGDSVNEGDILLEIMSDKTNMEIEAEDAGILLKIVRPAGDVVPVTEVIGYIGECHTHPMNLETLSGTDLNTIELLKEINKKTPIPTCAIIITQTKILPFIYE